MPYPTATLIGRLQVESRDPAAWRHVDNFDYVLDTALAEVGAVEPPVTLHSDLRQPFARAWLKVAQHEVLERVRVAVAFAPPKDMRVAPSTAAYIPKEGDRSLAELITAYRNEREAAHGVGSTDRRYNHIFSALREALGDDKPLRASRAATAGRRATCCAPSIAT